MRFFNTAGPIKPAMRAILGELASRTTLKDEFLDRAWPGILAKYGPGAALGEALAHWAEADETPLVLLVDEIDSLVGDSLLAVLRNPPPALKFMFGACEKKCLQRGMFGCTKGGG